MTTSKKKTESTSKKRRTTDDDEEWNPNPGEDVDEEEENDDEEMDVSRYKGIGRQCDWNSYMLARSPNQYGLQTDATMSFFYTKVQEDAYFGYIRTTIVHKHQYINMTFLMDKDVVAGLIANLHNIGLYDFLEHQCN